MAKPENPKAYPGAGDGMFLRDWFAGQIAAQTVHASLTGSGAIVAPDKIAQVSYLIADALLVERSK